MSVYYSEHDVELRQGDALTELERIPSATVQCIVTSPPYYGLRDYGVEGQIGLEATPGEYVETLRAVFDEARRVLRPDGVLWLNLGDSYSGKANHGATFDRHRGHGHQAGIIAPQRNTTAHAPYKSLLGMPWRVAFALVDDGWTLRNEVIWRKTNGMPDPVSDRLAVKHEQLFLFSARARYYFDLDAIREPHSAKTLRDFGDGQSAGRAFGKATSVDSVGVRSGNMAADAGRRPVDPRGVNPGTVWDIATQAYPGAHFATFPRALAARCILAGAPNGSTVLDPFAGAGTTLLAARQLGRRSIGIELNPAYCDMAVQRIGDTTLDFTEVSV